MAQHERYKDCMDEGRTVAIGDVHGCSAALAALVRAIDPTALDTLVFLGDYIDRGPDSRGVLDQVIALEQRCTRGAADGEPRGDAARRPRRAVRTALLAQVRGHGGPRLLRLWRWAGVRPADLRDLDPRRASASSSRAAATTSRRCGTSSSTPTTNPTDRCMSNRGAGCGGPPCRRSRSRHCSGKVAIVGHTPQKSGEILDLGYLKCIDTFCHGGGWLTALEVNTGRSGRRT